MKNIKSILKNHFQYFTYFYSHLRSRVFVALALSLIVGILDGFGLAMFLPLLQMVDGDQHQGDSDQLGNLTFLIEGLEYLGISLVLETILIVILIFFVLKGIMKFIEEYTRVIYQQYFIKNIRIKNIEYLSEYSYNQFVKSDIGKIQNTFSGEVNKVNQAYVNYFYGIQYAVLVFVYVVFAFSVNPQFAILVLIGGTLVNVVFKKLYRATKRLSKKITTDSHLFQGLLIQKVTHFKYLKATGLVNKYVSKLKRNIYDIEASQKKIGILNGLLLAIREPLVIFVVVVVIIVQVKFFSESLGLIILSLLFFYRSLNFLMALQNRWNSFLMVSGSLDNMTEFSKELSKGREHYGRNSFGKFDSLLSLGGVYFSYDDRKVLDNINLGIHKNETIAIVGESGSGKTTLMNVLAGLIKPQKGKVIVDGQNLEDIDIRTFQRRIGYITQDSVIFNDTIFNNVTFWDEKKSENLEKFYAALRKAAIEDFVRLLPGREDEILGSNGINLSGGQKQRISIARELYKDVDFLFMDEATSSLDSETEKSIQQNIEALKGQYTILVVAHRLATVKNADKVILLDSGRIENIGDFESLRSSSVLFKRMVELQKF